MTFLRPGLLCSPGRGRSRDQTPRPRTSNLGNNRVLAALVLVLERKSWVPADNGRPRSCALGHLWLTGTHGAQRRPDRREAVLQPTALWPTSLVWWSTRRHGTCALISPGSLCMQGSHSEPSTDVLLGGGARYVAVPRPLAPRSANGCMTQDYTLALKCALFSEDGAIHLKS